MSVVKKPKIKKPPTTAAESFTLTDINITQLDKNYALYEISKKQESYDKEDIKQITTSLEKLGISTYKKDPQYTVVYGDMYKITLFVNNGTSVYELNPTIKLRCSWCTLFPPNNVRMIAVPFKYVPSYIDEHVYSPDCVNIVNNINVEPFKENTSTKKEQKAQKLKIKINYLKKSITLHDRQTLPDGSYVKQEYFETSHPVCSFNCMISKARDLYMKDYKYKDVNMYINWLYKMIYGKYPDKILGAPHPDILKEYGGEYTPEEYRNDFNFITVNDTHQYYSTYKTMAKSVKRLFEKI